MQLVLLWTAAGALLLSGIPLCPVAYVSGHPCPGCGLTRASLAALAGHFHEASALHPLVFLVTPLFASFLALSSWRYFKTGSASLSRRQAQLFTVSFAGGYALLIALWIARFFDFFGGPVSV